MAAESRKLRVGMVGGGGPANFFGAPHRRGDPDGQLRRADRGRPPERRRKARSPRPRSSTSPGAIPTGRPSSRRKSRLPESERIDYLTIVTPNDAHFGPADAAAAEGDRRPLREAADDDARRGEAAPSRPRRNTRRRSSSPIRTPASRWSCSPRRWSRTAKIGKVRKVEAWYPQGWLASKHRVRRARSRRLAGRPARSRAPRAAAATSARMRTSSSGSSPGSRRSGSAPG